MEELEEEEGPDKEEEAEAEVGTEEEQEPLHLTSLTQARATLQLIGGL